MTASKPLKGKAQTRAEISTDIAAFEKTGGKVLHVSAKPARRTKYENIDMVVPRASQYDAVSLSKIEMLMNILTIGGQDPLNIPGTKKNKLTTHDVWAAVGQIRVGRLSKHHVWGRYDKRKLKMFVSFVVIYKYVPDEIEQRNARGHLFSELLNIMMERAGREKWDYDKPQIVENLILTALRNLADPHKFKGKERLDTDGKITDTLSQRQWAAQLRLGCHKDWAKRWRKRYLDLLNDITELDTLALDEIERQL